MDNFFKEPEMMQTTLVIIVFIILVSMQFVLNRILAHQKQIVRLLNILVNKDGGKDD